MNITSYNIQAYQEGLDDLIEHFDALTLRTKRYPVEITFADFRRVIVHGLDESLQDIIDSLTLGIAAFHEGEDPVDTDPKTFTSEENHRARLLAYEAGRESGKKFGGSLAYRNIFFTLGIVSALANVVFWVYR